MTGTTKIFEGIKNIKIVGIGGAGCNTVKRIAEAGLTGVDGVAINTDAQSLAQITEKDIKKIQIGKELTKGLSADGNPEIGKQATEENQVEIAEALAGADLVFIIAGMGGGTGTGASPVVANIVKKPEKYTNKCGFVVEKDADVLVAAFVTLPFSFEGIGKTEKAKAGCIELQKKSDYFTQLKNDFLITALKTPKTYTEEEKFVKGEISLLDLFRKFDDIIIKQIKMFVD